MDNNVQTICRICTCNNADRKSIYAVDTFSDKFLEINEVIVVCASVQIQRSDSLPKEICSKCLLYLHYAYTFKSLCENSDHKLRNRLEQNGIETDVIKEEMHDFNYSDSDRDAENVDSELEEFKNLHKPINNDFHGTLFKAETQISNYIDSKQIDEIIKIVDVKEVEMLSDVFNFNEKSGIDNTKSQPVRVKEEVYFDYAEVEPHSETILESPNLSNSDNIKDESIDVSETNLEFVDLNFKENNENTNLTVEKRILKKVYSKKNLDKRSRQSHKQLRYKCFKQPLRINEREESLECNDELQSDTTLKKHKRTQSFECKVSSTSQDRSIKPTQIQLIKKRKRKKYRCEICNKQVNKLKQHLQIHTGEKDPKKKLLKCDICNKEVVNLRVHVKIHAFEKEFKCNICEMPLSTSRSLENHLTLHSGEKPFKCDICDQRYPSANSLRSHMSLKHSQQSFECHLCSKVFANRAYMVRHIHNSHKMRSERKSLCNICNKEFVNIKRHLKTHEERQFFKCDVCEVQLSSEYTLKTHMTIHTGQKPFKCDTCGKQFAHVGILNRHKKTHNV